MLRTLLLAAVATIGLTAAVPAGAASFAFDDHIGSTNDFSITAGGLTAAFSSSNGPGVFAVAEPTGIFSFPVALGITERSGAIR